MSRHNRRRTRGSHRSSSSQPPLPPSSFSLTPLPTTTTTPSASALPSHPPRSYSRRNELSAQHWHNRYMAWHVRERRQAEEGEKLDVEKKRLFGKAEDDCRIGGVCFGDGYRGCGGPGSSENVEEDEEGEEDQWLGERMREYFGGLDFIEHI